MDQIYDDLSAKFDRFPENESYSPSNIIAQIIEDYWNIDKNLVLDDFEFEIERQSKFQISIPDIPTYKIRFAIEEGSWSVLLRNHLKILMRDEFKHLLALEDLIWGTDAGSLDDIAYYVIEMKQFIQKWIESIFSVWKQNHDYGKLEDFAIQIIGGYHQVDTQRGELYYEGGLRLFKSKLSKLAKIEKMAISSQFINSAVEWVSLVLENQDEGLVAVEDVIEFIIGISLIQKEIQNITQLRQIPKIINKSEFSWDAFNPFNASEKEEFIEYILRQLYLRPEEDPIQASRNLIRTELSNFGVNDGVINQTIQRLDSIIDESDTSTDNIDRLQIIIPEILINIKSENLQNKKTNTNLVAINSLDVWDVLIDTIARASRISDKSMRFKTVESIVNSTYNYLISMDLESRMIISLFLQHISDEFTISDDVLQELTDSFEKLTDNLNQRNYIKAKLDKSYKALLTQEFLRLLHK